MRQFGIKNNSAIDIFINWTDVQFFDKNLARITSIKICQIFQILLSFASYIEVFSVEHRKKKSCEKLRLGATQVGPFKLLNAFLMLKEDKQVYGDSPADHPPTSFGL